MEQPPRKQSLHVALMSYVCCKGFGGHLYPVDEVFRSNAAAFDCTDSGEAQDTFRKLAEVWTQFVQIHIPATGWALLYYATPAFV